MNQEIQAIITGGKVSDKNLRGFACRCAKRALDRERSARRKPDVRSLAAVRAAESFVNGEISESDLKLAEDAALEAVAAADEKRAHAAEVADIAEDVANDKPTKTNINTATRTDTAYLAACGVYFAAKSAAYAADSRVRYAAFYASDMSGRAATRVCQYSDDERIAFDTEYALQMSDLRDLM